MRVSLPVDPGHKTRGEVATLRWLQHQTNIPVPQVFDFDDSNKNEIGFEWILMEYMPGTSADKRWRGMSMAQKTALVEKVAEYQVQILFPRPHEREFNTIGTLDSKDVTGWNHLKSTPYITPGQLVDYTFFWGDNYCRNVPRGPFRSSQEWLISLVSIVLQELSAKGREAEDEADRELTVNTRKILCKLLYMVPKMFPEKRSAESTFLWHEDLSLENILVDHEGNITAVLDWECVSTMPSWVATRTPLFLVGLEREDEPDREIYASDLSDNDNSDTDGTEITSIDNEGKCELYWEHLADFEKTQLRKAYAARMEILRPGWTEEFESNCLKVDFLEAIQHCRSGIFTRSVSDWIDAMRTGGSGSLQEFL
ncbi:Altered inheritance of mitochondria protein 9 [Colletotrichum viniferum]|nr:Altered inheritance of mitochondria protein 9 [Colletotrichum viniferum]